jgi:2-polyprenyl-6-methoxyphenol hydroxylase-like FAD-dependent oxidoreductase
MRVAIIGAGPTGLFCAIALARRGHEIALIDRDPGPTTAAGWRRRGVMQFHHPHAFRKQVCDAMEAEMPDAYESLLAAGAEPFSVPELPGVTLGLRCRRMTFERVLRRTAQDQAGITFMLGHAGAVVSVRGRATGVSVDGRLVDADLVVDASGRAGLLAENSRGPIEGDACGITYVSRQYQLRPGAVPGPMNAPIGMTAQYLDYLIIVFLHEHSIFSTLIQSAATDQELAVLRTEPAFTAASQAIPALAAWTDPERSTPLSPVLAGGKLHNSYRGQLNQAGRIPLDGLIFVGDSVCTTNPTLGRGVATSFMQAQHLLDLLDEHGRDFTSAALAFDLWCVGAIKPWFSDHVYSDFHLRRRWSGEDIDLSQPLPSDLICAATEKAPDLGQTVGPYQAMMALPHTLAAAEPTARDVYTSGWRPPIPDGPTHSELVDIIQANT